MSSGLVYSIYVDFFFCIFTYFSFELFSDKKNPIQPSGIGFNSHDFHFRLDGIANHSLVHGCGTFFSLLYQFSYIGFIISLHINRFDKF